MSAARAAAPRRPGAAGVTLLEMLIAVALLGFIVLAVARLSDAVMRRMPRMRAQDLRWSLSLGLVPALREDIRRSIATALWPPGLDPGTDVLVLDRSLGEGTRLVVWSAEPGRIGRRELQRDAFGGWQAGRVRDWRGAFLPQLGWSPASGSRRGLVELRIRGSDAPGEPAVLSFAFGLRP